jgi:hypothetical protein
MISISLVLLLGAAIVLAWRYMGLRVWQAVICAVFGFYLAQTTAAPAVRHLITSIVGALTTGQH